jgi:hypothetical protein
VVQSEIERGIVSVGTALGNPRALAPFFRIPGFLRRQEVEAYLQSRGLATWSADIVADDWKHISTAEVVRRAMGRLDEKGKGILLLHDIQPATALALPELLRELKTKGYRVVHVVPGKGPTRGPVGEKPAEAAVQAAASESPAVKAASIPVAETAASAAPVTAHAEVAPPASPAAAKNAVLPALPAQAADRLAKGEEIAGPPARPFTDDTKPSKSMPTPAKLLTSDSGGWPPVVSVPVPAAGGIGVSPVARGSGSSDGRFR